MIRCTPGLPQNSDTPLSVASQLLALQGTTTRSPPRRALANACPSLAHLQPAGCTQMTSEHSSELSHNCNSSWLMPAQRLQSHGPTTNCSLHNPLTSDAYCPMAPQSACGMPTTEEPPKRLHVSGVPSSVPPQLACSMDQMTWCPDNFPLVSDSAPPMISQQGSREGLTTCCFLEDRAALQAQFVDGGGPANDHPPDAERASGLSPVTLSLQVSGRGMATCGVPEPLCGGRSPPSMSVHPAYDYGLHPGHDDVDEREDNSGSPPPLQPPKLRAIDSSTCYSPGRPRSTDTIASAVPQSICAVGPPRRSLPPEPGSQAPSPEVTDLRTASASLASAMTHVEATNNDERDSRKRSASLLLPDAQVGGEKAVGCTHSGPLTGIVDSTVAAATAAAAAVSVQGKISRLLPRESPRPGFKRQRVSGMSRASTSKGEQLGSPRASPADVATGSAGLESSSLPPEQPSDNVDGTCHQLALVSSAQDASIQDQTDMGVCTAPPRRRANYKRRCSFRRSRGPVGLSAAIVAVQRGSGGRPAPGKPCFTTTGVVLKAQQRRIIDKLGASFSSDCGPDVTHIVADTFRRTTKMMCAICRGVRAVIPDYLGACEMAGRLIDEGPFELRDHVCEQAFARKRGIPGGYSLAMALERARRNGPLLKGMSVYCFPSVEDTRELPLVVAAAGGRWLPRFPDDPDAATMLLLAEPVVSGDHEREKRALHTVYDVELLREAVCTQELRLDAYKLK